MKFSVLQENLQQALLDVSQFTSNKTQLPILSNILFSTDSGRLKLSATNLSLAINYHLGAKIDQEGSITIPHKEITEFVSYLSPGRLDFDLNPQKLVTLKSAQAQSTFTTAPATDFPDMPEFDPKTAFTLDLSLLRDSVEKIAFAAATDDSRPVLTAISCQFSPDSITLVATDGFRLSIKDIKLTQPLDLRLDKKNTTFLVPARSFRQLIKLAQTDKTIKVGLTTDRNQIVFVLEDVDIISRLLEGDYPDYNRIVPDSSTTKVFINRSDLDQAVKIASVFAVSSANVVRFNAKSNSLTLSANAPQIGQNQASLDARLEGAPVEIAFNYKFVSDFLAICQGDEIVLELNDSLSPGIFRDQLHPYYHACPSPRLIFYSHTNSWLSVATSWLASQSNTSSSTIFLSNPLISTTKVSGEVYLSITNPLPE